MADMRQLREALRTREALAPDPDAVLAGAHGRIRRRRAQRRVAGVAVAVAVVIAGVGAGMTLLRPSDEPASIEVAAGAADAPVAAPALPFTVDLPPGFDLVGWTVSGSVANGRYTGYYGARLEVTVSDGEFQAPPTPALQGGGPGQVTYPSGGGIRLQRQIVPGRLVTVLTKSGMYTPERLAEIAGSVRLVPTPVPSLLRTLRVPAGLTVRQWSGEAGFDHLTLCPAEVPVTSPARTDGRCYSVTVYTGADGPLRVTTTTAAPPDDRPDKSVRRLLTDGKALTIETESGTEAVMDAIAASAVGS